MFSCHSRTPCPPPEAYGLSSHERGSGFGVRRSGFLVLGSLVLGSLVLGSLVLGSLVLGSLVLSSLVPGSLVPGSLHTSGAARPRLRSALDSSLGSRTRRITSGGLP